MNERFVVAETKEERRLHFDNEMIMWKDVADSVIRIIRENEFSAILN